MNKLTNKYILINRDIGTSCSEKKTHYIFPILYCRYLCNRPKQSFGFACCRSKKSAAKQCISIAHYRRRCAYITVCSADVIIYGRLQVTCPKGHLSEMELCRFRNLTLNLTLTLTLTLILTLTLTLTLTLYLYL